MFPAIYLSGKKFMTSEKTTPKDISLTVNRWGYVAFVLLSFYFLFVSNDLVSAASNMGIALIFDPFNPAVKWTNRKSWQKGWLLLHVSLTLGMLLYGLLIMR
jgi:hypothetical protein